MPRSSRYALAISGVNPVISTVTTPSGIGPPASAGRELARMVTG
jgi:hypothetical protein